MSPLSRSQLLKGTTEMLILGVLETERLHGYDILQRIRDAGSGLIVSEGALYPALHRLESRGAVTASWEPGNAGPRRRYYVLTDAGRGQLADARREWERFVADVEAVTSSPAPAEARHG
ncbi:MAG TPA: helix-turn-helix transcriptional regulator [Candidatus Limnocylindria bacterium]|nr:helix-turn-helix transcriptional regulator [Candidatus Limnocylindria bacterium]